MSRNMDGVCEVAKWKKKLIDEATRDIVRFNNWLLYLEKLDDADANEIKPFVDHVRKLTDRLVEILDNQRPR